jgi:hypothetical protein
LREDAAIWDMVAMIMDQRKDEFPLGAVFEHKGEVRLYQHGDWHEADLHSLHPDVPKYQIEDWRDLATLAGARLRTGAQVLEIIDPVNPDNLYMIGPNIFEAKWGPPVLMMDIEILRGTPGIVVLGEPFEPEHLPGWLAVHFAVTEVVDTLDND